MPDDNGQKRFRGKLNGINDNVISLTTEHGDAAIELGDVSKAKLVLTEELFEGKPKGQKKNLNPQRKIKPKKITEDSERESEDL